MIEANQKAALRAELEAYQKRTLLYTRPGFLIRRMHQIHSWLFTEETGAFNITPVQYSLLTSLREHGELDQNSLALDIGLERSSVAEVLPRLESRGLIERRQSQEDRRVKRVRLTRQGRTLIRRMQPAVKRAHDRTIEQLPEDVRDWFMLQMIRLVEANNSHAVAPLRIR